MVKPGLAAESRIETIPVTKCPITYRGKAFWLSTSIPCQVRPWRDSLVTGCVGFDSLAQRRITRETRSTGFPASSKVQDPRDGFHSIAAAALWWAGSAVSSASVSRVSSHCTLTPPTRVTHVPSACGELKLTGRTDGFKIF